MPVHPNHAPGPTHALGIPNGLLQRIFPLQDRGDGHIIQGVSQETGLGLSIGYKSIGYKIMQEKLCRKNTAVVAAIEPR